VSGQPYAVTVVKFRE